MREEKKTQQGNKVTGHLAIQSLLIIITIKDATRDTTSSSSSSPSASSLSSASVWLTCGEFLIDFVQNEGRMQTRFIWHWEKSSLSSRCETIKMNIISRMDQSTAKMNECVLLWSPLPSTYHSRWSMAMYSLAQVAWYRVPYLEKYRSRYKRTSLAMIQKWLLT